MPSQKNPFDAAPLSNWPKSLAYRWTSSPAVGGWGADYGNRVLTAVGRLLTAMSSWGLDPALLPTVEVVNRYRAEIGPFLTASSVRTELDLVAYGMLALHPSASWTDLQAWSRVPNSSQGISTKARRAAKPNSKRRSMPFNEWPQQQQEAWNRPEPAPVFKIQSLQRAEKSKGKPKIGVSLGPTVTDRNRRRSWGRFLFWQSMNATIGEKPTPESLERYVAHEECNGSSEISTTTYVWGIYYAARKIWPEHEWNWLLQDASGMKLIARPSRKKMEQFIPIGEICRLGFKLMDKAERMLPTRRAAILYRDGLLMVLLAFRPKRIANIRSLTIGESLLLNEDGIPYGLSFDRTKNGDASHTTLPRCLVHHVLRYLSVYRPLLLGHRSSRHLWISQHARPLHEGSYWCLVAKRTGEACGRKIGPHMIRTCFATSVAQERRELLPAVSKMLDHRDRRSIEPYQLLASSIAASRTLENKLEGLFKAHGSNYTS